MFALYPLWWLLGLVDVMWAPFAVMMALYLHRRGALRAPRGFGFWLLFLVWMLLSIIELDGSARLAGFTYRATLYLAFTIVFLYVYNGRPTISERFVCGLLTVFWLITVLGGYLGVLFPRAVLDTLASRVLPHGLLTNELVNQMVVRRFAQFNPDAYFYIDPRPSAPFLYTNNWGNAFSLLVPFVIAYLVMVRGERKFWWLVAALAVSLVPAFLTLNRGMYLGLAVAMAYAALRLGLMRHSRAFVALLLVAVVGGTAFMVLPARDRLANRLESSSTTEDRAALYVEAWDATQKSPVFGYGAPRPSATKGAPSVGTQGQFWLVLYSHGVGAVVGFIGWFLIAFVSSLRRTDPTGLACSTVLLVALVELGYYGWLPQGLPLVMVAAALALRGRDPVSPAA